MVFNDNNNQNINDSIFTDTSQIEGRQAFPVEETTKRGENIIIKLFESFVEKFIDEPKRKKEIQNYIKSGTETLSEFEDILTLFHDTGCNIIVKDNLIELEYPVLNLKGTITLKDGEAVFDEVTNKILAHISAVIVNTNKLDDILNSYEEEGFYPVGDLTKKTIILNGKQTEVLLGEMMNKKGETRNVYYYKGKEVTPDK